jgi:hypothetical protein
MRQMIQRAAQIDGNQASGDLESRLNASKGGGSPLSEGVRGFMEPRFGADFSGVRVHTGSEAVQMNKELGAQAFTHGSDVYFGEGKSPGNNELTAHELTHVMQQNEEVLRNKNEQTENSQIHSQEIQTIVSRQRSEGYLQAQEEQSHSQSESNPESSTVEYAIDETTGQRYIIEYRIEPGRQPGTFIFLDAYDTNRNQVYANQLYPLDYEYEVYNTSRFQYVRRASSGKIEHFPVGESFRLYIGDELLVHEHLLSVDSNNAGEYGESLLTSRERSGVQELLSGMNGINRNAALFIAGAFYQWLRNNGELGRWVLEAVSLGTSSVSEDLEAVEESLPKSGPFEMGRTAGDLAGIVTGVLEMIAGGGAVAGGGSLCLTGIGCIAGAPATVVGGATVVHGGSVVVEATGNLAEDLAGLVSQVFAISGGRGRPPEFPGGTLTESEFLSAVEDFLGSGYTEVSPGRYLSTDGMRQVRFGSHETRGLKLHGHFEAYDRPGGRVVENTVVDIVPDP